jgi:hypothetical protein
MQFHHVLFIAILLLLPARLRGQEVPLASQDPASVEVLARGPVHEAFAQPPDVGRPEGGPVVPKEPPPSVEELPPEQKPDSDTVQWVPGYWQWDAERGDFLWVSGAWREPPPGRQWVPGAWRQVDGGWQWVSGFWAPASQDDPPVQEPPPESLESGPSSPPPEEEPSFYTPGCWIPRATRYVWRPGYWVSYRPGWVWVPCHYAWTPDGCVFVDGYWDYPLHRRGLLFAPVCFEHSFRGPWTPEYVVSASFLPGALFVQPSQHHYYFGDYFGSTYRRAGFTPWVDFRLGHSTVDPLFAYYRLSGGRAWEQNVTNLYAARADGRLAAPPRTLVQQTRTVHELRRQTSDVQRIRRSTVLTPLTQVPRNVTALTTVGREERIRQQRAASRLAASAHERLRVEPKLPSRHIAPVRPSTQPRTVPFESPHVARSLPSHEARPREWERRIETHPALPRRESVPALSYDPRRFARESTFPGQHRERSLAVPTPAPHRQAPEHFRPQPQIPRHAEPPHVARRVEAPPSVRRGVEPPRHYQPAAPAAPRHAQAPPPPRHAAPAPAPRPAAPPAPRHVQHSAPAPRPAAPPAPRHFQHSAPAPRPAAPPAPRHVQQPAPPAHHAAPAPHNKPRDKPH